MIFMTVHERISSPWRGKKQLFGHKGAPKRVFFGTILAFRGVFCTTFGCVDERTFHETGV
jgi:hypothetical protein